MKIILELIPVKEGHDKILLNIFKMNNESLSKAISKIINKIYQEGIFPSNAIGGNRLGKGNAKGVSCDKRPRRKERD